MSLVELQKPVRTEPQPSNFPSDPSAGQVDESDRYWGAILRRKWLLLFFALLGAGTGLLVYKRLPPVYESRLTLMVWTLEPPRLVESGDAFVQPNNTGKHEQLLSSTAVLRKASESEKLSTLPWLANSENPVAALKSMVTVSRKRDAAETFSVSARGPKPGDLPIVLREVVNAYQTILKEDTEKSTTDYSELMQALQSKITSDKNETTEEYFQLLQELGLSGQEVQEFRNPFYEDLQISRKRLSVANDEYRALQDLVAGLPEEEALAAEADPLIKVTAMEAAQYLGYSRTAPIMTAAEQLESPIQEIDRRISELELQIGKAIASVGENHPTVSSLKIDIEFFENKRKALLKELAQAEIEQADADEEEKSLLEITANDRELISMYASSLKRELHFQEQAVQDLREELELMQAKSDVMAVKISRLNMVSKEIQQKDEVIRGIVDQLSEVAVLKTREDFSSTKIRVIDNPSVGNYVAPIPGYYAMFGALAASIVGVGVILVLDWSEQSFRNPKEISDRLHLNVLARIPEINQRKIPFRNVSEHISILNNPHSDVSEGYRTCRTALHFAMNRDAGNVLLVTSPTAGDGKSTTAANLAVSFARMGQRVVIVDADLRRPRCHVYLDDDISPGLYQLATGEVSSEEIVRPSHLVENLSVITAGGIFSDPAEFLESGQFQGLLNELKNDFDYVIIDSPPVLPVADTISLAPYVDGILFVFRIRRGVALSAEKGIEMLRMVDGKLLGVAVNGIDKNCFYSDYGKYGYSGYGSQGYFARRYYESDNKKYHRGP